MKASFDDVRLKLISIAVTVIGLFIGGCSTVEIYARQQQDRRIESNARQSAANCARLQGMESDISWIRESLSRIEIRQRPVDDK